MRGILLLNIGTPESASVRDVRRYLREFLSDSRVITLPAPLRFILLNCIILPFRSKNSAEAYQSVWTESGSPLMVFSMQLQQLLQQHVASDVAVAFGMRYGSPSIKTAVKELTDKGCNSITVLPLFPQYSSAATGSAISEALRIMRKFTNIPEIRVVNDFYQHPAFIAAYAAKLQSALQAESYDHVLFSYHGLPELQVAQSCAGSVCSQTESCPIVTTKNQYCYRAQSFATTTSLANVCELAEGQYTTSFQSRLGKLPWIKPYTDEIIKDLYNKGVRRLLVICPSFVTDCLETLEEISIRLREDWLELGGDVLEAVPCLNADPDWVAAISELCDTDK